MVSNGFMKRAAGIGLGAALIAGAIVTGVAVADSPDGFGGRGHGRMGMAMGLHGLRALNLSDDQKTKIKAAFQAQKPAYQALHQTARANRQALAALTKSANPDPAAVGAAYLKTMADRQAFAAQRQAAKATVEALLTPDQKTQFEQMQSAGGFRRQSAQPN